MPRPKLIVRTTRTYKDDKVIRVQTPSIADIRAAGDRYLILPVSVIHTLEAVPLAVLARLMSKGPRHHWTKDRLKAEFPDLSHRALNAAKANLIKAGYVLIIPAQLRNGTWAGHVWYVTTTPSSFPCDKNAKSERISDREFLTGEAPTGVTPCVITDGVIPIVSTPTYNHSLPSPEEERVKTDPPEPGKPISEKGRSVVPIEERCHDEMETPCGWGAHPKRALAWVQRSHFAAVLRSLVAGQPEWTERSARAFYTRFRKGAIKAMDILTMKRIGASAVLRANPLVTSIEDLCRYWNSLIRHFNTDAHYSEWIGARSALLREAKALHASFGRPSDINIESWRKGTLELFPSVLDALVYASEEGSPHLPEIAAWVAAQRLPALIQCVARMELSAQIELPFRGILSPSQRPVILELVRASMAENWALAEANGDTDVVANMKIYLNELAAL